MHQAKSMQNYGGNSGNPPPPPPPRREIPKDVKKRVLYESSEKTLARESREAQVRVLVVMLIGVTNRAYTCAGVLFSHMNISVYD